MNEELKPCPFCGGAPKLYKVEGFGRWYFRCTGCGIYTNMQISEGIAKKQWNRRTPDGDVLPPNWKDALRARFTR